MSSAKNKQKSLSGRILITDAHWNKSVAAIRSLGRSGLKVTAGESSRLAAGLFSKYVKRRLIYPAPVAQPDLFVDAIEQELQNHKYDLIIPMELNTLLLLSKNRHRLEPYTQFPFAPHDVLTRAAGKIETTRAAREINIPMPTSRAVTIDTSSADLLIDPGIPLILKPDLGEGGRGLFYCHNEDEVSESLSIIKKIGTKYLAQELIPAGGDAIGVSVLMGKKQEVLASFTHRRLREFPISGGPSCLRESYNHPAAEKAALKLLKAMDWQGVAMVEFKIDPRDNQPKLMEINPRFWGSLPLAIAAGIDFPYLLYCDAMGIPFDLPQQKEGTRVRNFLPGDLLYLWAKRGKVKPEFWSLGDAEDDLLSWRDPGPVLGRLLSPIACLYDPQLKSVMQKRQ